MYINPDIEKMKGVDDNRILLDFLSKFTDSPSSSSSPSPPVNNGVFLSSSKQSPSSGFHSSAFSPSNYSPSSSFSCVNGDASSSDEFSPTQTPFTLQNQTPDNPFLYNKLFMDSQSPDFSSGYVNNPSSSYQAEKCSMLYEQSLSENLCKMKLLDEQKSMDFANIRQFQGNPNGFGDNKGSYNVGNYSPSQYLNNGNIAHGSGGFPSPFHKAQMGYNVEKCNSSQDLNNGNFAHDSTWLSSPFHNAQMGYGVEKCNPSQDLNNGNVVHDSSWLSSPFHNAQMGCANVGSALPQFRSAGDPMESPVPHYQFSDLYKNKMYHHMLEQRREQWKKDLFHGGVQFQNSSTMYDKGSMYKTRNRSIPTCEVPQSYSPLNHATKPEGFGYEDSYIMQEHSFNHANKNGGDRSKGLKTISCNNGVATRTPIMECLEQENQTQCDLTWLPTYTPLDGMQKSIYILAKDQNGCRLLQKLFDEKDALYDQNVNMIFRGLIYHVVELMTNPFGNYLVQKLFQKCSDEQRARITAMVTTVPGELIKISMNTHGTRSVQTLIANLKTKQQIFSVVSALSPGFLDLIKDVNGNHVVHRCLTTFGIEHNKFIFDVAIRFCADIATHKNGCCILIKCLEISSGGIRNALVEKIAVNALCLAQDSFGNYVVQKIIEEIPYAHAIISSHLKGNYAYLSMQKFSSHVVEKCLSYIVDSRPIIISELMSVSHFEQMLQHPYANYVIKSALDVTKGHLHAMLIEKLKSYNTLKTNPYCKKIFSRNLLRK